MDEVTAKKLLTKPCLSHQERYIGPQHIDIAISSVYPSYYGFDISRFVETGISSHASGEIWLQKLFIRIGTMIHLVQKFEDSFELRSRYWLADSVKVKVPLIRCELDFDRLVQTFGLKSRFADLSIDCEQLLHGQIEFTNLASFLPEIYYTFAERSTKPSCDDGV